MSNANIRPSHIVYLFPRFAAQSVSMNRHVRSHEWMRWENISYMCTLCSLEYLPQRELRFHIRRRQVRVGPQLIQQITTMPIYLVNICYLHSTGGILSNHSFVAFSVSFLQITLQLSFQKPLMLGYSTLTKPVLIRLLLNENEQPLVRRFDSNNIKWAVYMTCQHIKSQLKGSLHVKWI